MYTSYKFKKAGVFFTNDVLSLFVMFLDFFKFSFHITSFQVFFRYQYFYWRIKWGISSNGRARALHARGILLFSFEKHK